MLNKECNLRLNPWPSLPPFQKANNRFIAVKLPPAARESVEGTILTVIQTSTPTQQSIPTLSAEIPCSQTQKYETSTKPFLQRVKSLFKMRSCLWTRIPARCPLRSKNSPRSQVKDRIQCSFSSVKWKDSDSPVRRCLSLRLEEERISGSPKWVART